MLAVLKVEEMVELMEVYWVDLMAGKSVEVLAALKEYLKAEHMVDSLVRLWVD